MARTDEMKKHLEKIIIASFIVLLVVQGFLLIDKTADARHFEKLYFETKKHLNDTTYALNLARTDQERWFEFREKIEATKSLGFAPDSLVMWTIIDLRNQFPGVGGLVDSVAQYESSWGYNKKNGLIGEKGWAQIRPETLCYIVYGLGGDTTDMHRYYYNNPLPVKSTTEYFYAIATMTRFLNGDVFYEHWNRGMFAKIKKRAGYKTKKIGRYSTR